MGLEAYPWTEEQDTARVWTPEPRQSEGDARDPFERDRARIIHSVAFRRLQGKTQIFSSSTDFLRTRVTHSIEVAQIGRALAQRFAVNESLVEAACLGHDLGHPPFGHTGEEVLAEVTEHVREAIEGDEIDNGGDEITDPGAFEGNAQSFRVVTRLEKKDPEYSGLDLCRATLQGLVKYPYRRSAGHSKFLYDDDVADMEAWLFEGTDGAFLTAYDAGEAPPRTLPCQLMDWADDIAYSVHDLEDGIASGMLDPGRWKSDAFLEQVAVATARAPNIRWEAGAPPSRDQIDPIVEDLSSRLSDRIDEAGTVPLDVIRDVSRHYIDKFVVAATVTQIRAGGSLFDYSLDVPEEIRIENQVLKTITFEFVVNDAETRRLSFKGKEILRELFWTLFENTLENAGSDRLLLFPRSMRDELETLSARQAARAVCDYLATMTEGQALRLYAHLFEPAASLEVGNV